MYFSDASMTSVSPYSGSAQLFFTHDLILTKYYITLAMKDCHFLAYLLLAILLVKVFVAKRERKPHSFWGHLPLPFNHLLLPLVGPSCLLSESPALSIFSRTHLHFGLCMQNDPKGFLAIAADKSILNLLLPWLYVFGWLQWWLLGLVNFHPFVTKIAPTYSRENQYPPIFLKRKQWITKPVFCCHWAAHVW